MRAQAAGGAGGAGGASFRLFRSCATRATGTRLPASLSSSLSFSVSFLFASFVSLCVFLSSLSVIARYLFTPSRMRSLYLSISLSFYLALSLSLSLAQDQLKRSEQDHQSVLFSEEATRSAVQVLVVCFVYLFENEEESVENVDRS